MEHNVGGWDRDMRWVLGTAAAVTALLAPLPKSWRLGLLAFSATEFLTAGTRYCPLNKALGVDTTDSESLTEKAKTLVA